MHLPTQRPNPITESTRVHYIDVGRWLSWLGRRLENETRWRVVNDIERVVNDLHRLNFTQTIAVASQWQEFTAAYGDPTSAESDKPLTESDRQFVGQTLECVIRALEHEAGSHPVILRNTQNVSDRLRGFPNHVQLNSQSLNRLVAAKADAIRCLELGLARPAIVSAWNMGFDFVREWIFSGNNPPRLNAFNITYGQRAQRGNWPVQSIVEYEDFYRVGERRILDVCRDEHGETGLQAFTSKEHDELTSLLTRRNRFAHANDHVATTSQAQAYIEDLLNVLVNQPFTTW